MCWLHSVYGDTATGIEMRDPSVTWGLKHVNVKPWTVGVAGRKVKKLREKMSCPGCPGDSLDGWRLSLHHCSNFWRNQRVILKIKSLNLSCTSCFLVLQIFFLLFFPQSSSSCLNLLTVNNCEKNICDQHTCSFFPACGKQNVSWRRLASCALANLQTWLRQPGCRFYFYKNRICIGFLCTQTQILSYPADFFCCSLLCFLRAFSGIN